MNQTPTFQESYDKIIQAYFKDELKPLNGEFCFCGTLSPDYDWRDQGISVEYPYTPTEYGRMEKALLSKFSQVRWINICSVEKKDKDTPVDKLYTEDELFAGMVEALEELKQIHTERGENVEDCPLFTKRILSHANRSI